MNTDEIKTFLNRLSKDFNGIPLNIQFGNEKYAINDIQLKSEEIVLIANQRNVDTIFDSYFKEDKYSLVCTHMPPGLKLQMVKSLKEATGLGLKEAKDIIDGGTPFKIKTASSKQELDAIKNIFPDGTGFSYED